MCSLVLSSRQEVERDQEEMELGVNFERFET